jgi:hypothetical protein
VRKFLIPCIWPPVLNIWAGLRPNTAGALSPLFQRAVLKAHPDSATATDDSDDLSSSRIFLELGKHCPPMLMLTMTIAFSSRQYMVFSHACDAG